MKNVMIDTEIWSIAKKRPDRKNFASRKEFIKAMNMHRKAREFFINIFPELKVYMSIHQLAEIYHVLAFRGTRVPRNLVENIVKSIIEDNNIVKVPITLRHIEIAVKESVENNIHIWDYLCFIPIKDFIDIIYTCDKHFIKIGEKYKVRIVNPLDNWITS